MRHHLTQTHKKHYNRDMKNLSENRRARYDYEILETFEAGISLTGQEVKSVRSGRMDLSGSYCLVRSGEAWLLNSTIPAFQPKNTPKKYDPSRSRKLLLNKKEISKLIGALHEKGTSLIPLRVYAKNSFVKIELSLARPRKKHDRRELLKKRAVEKEVRRET